MRGLYTEKVAPGKIPFGRLVREILEPGAGEAVSSRIREIGPTQDAYGRTSDVREPIRKADATDADEAAFLLGQRIRKAARKKARMPRRQKIRTFWQSDSAMTERARSTATTYIR